MTFSHVMKLVGAGLGAAAGVAVAVATLPVWVGPALAGAATVAGVLATSPRDAAVVNAVREAAKAVPSIVPGNTKAAVAAGAAASILDRINKAE